MLFIWFFGWFGVFVVGVYVVYSLRLVGLVGLMVGLGGFALFTGLGFVGLLVVWVGFNAWFDWVFRIGLRFVSLRGICLFAV